MHQVKIDLIEPQLLQAFVERPADCVGCEVFVPDLGGDVQIATREARSGNRSTDSFLVGIHFRGIDMAIAEGKGAFDRGAADIALHAKRAEPKPRQADALGFEMFHGSLLKTVYRRTESRRCRTKQMLAEAMIEMADAISSVPAKHGTDQGQPGSRYCDELRNAAPGFRHAPRRLLCRSFPVADAAGLARPALYAGVECLGLERIAMPRRELCSSRAMRPRMAEGRCNADARRPLDRRRSVDRRSHLLHRHFPGFGFQCRARPPSFAIAVGIRLDRNSVHSQPPNFGERVVRQRNRITVMVYGQTPTIAREFQSDLLANAATRAGHDSHSVFQTHGWNSVASRQSNARHTFPVVAVSARRYASAPCSIGKRCVTTWLGAMSWRRKNRHTCGG